MEIPDIDLSSSCFNFGEISFKRDTQVSQYVIINNYIRYFLSSSLPLEVFTSFSS